MLNFKLLEIREPLIIINLSLPRRRESSDVKGFWIPAFAGMTFLEVAISNGIVMLNLIQHLQNKTDPEIVDPELNSGPGSG
jgi:hypothetical protein